jgi:hypothetical protein
VPVTGGLEVAGSSGHPLTQEHVGVERERCGGAASFQSLRPVTDTPLEHGRTDVDAHAEKGRRAAGTRTVVEVLRAWAGRPRSTPERDIVDMIAGEPLVVAAILNQEHRWRQGTLRIAMKEAPCFVWSPRRAAREPVLFSSPIQTRGVKGSASDGKRYTQFVFVIFQSAGRTFEMAVPATDSKLVEEAFARSRPPS